MLKLTTQLLYMRRWGKFWVVWQMRRLARPPFIGLAEWTYDAKMDGYRDEKNTCRGAWNLMSLFLCTCNPASFNFFPSIFFCLTYEIKYSVLLGFVWWILESYEFVRVYQSSFFWFFFFHSFSFVWPTKWNIPYSSACLVGLGILWVCPH